MNELEQAQREDLVRQLLDKQEENGRLHHEVCKLRLAIHTWADSFWAPVNATAGSIAAHEAAIDNLLAVVGREIPKRDGTGR